MWPQYNRATRTDNAKRLGAVSHMLDGRDGGVGLVPRIHSDTCSRADPPTIGACVQYLPRMGAVPIGGTLRGTAVRPYPGMLPPEARSVMRLGRRCQSSEASLPPCAQFSRSTS